MAFRFIVADDDGVIYAATTAGDLLWYRPRAASYSRQAH